MSVPLIPREVLFGNPERVHPSLSPDGTRLAWLAPDEGVMNVFVKTIGKDDDRAVTADRRRGIQDYGWAEDDVHILYVQDRDGDENWHLYRISAAGGEPTDLTPLDDIQARIVAMDRDHPHEILVGINDRNPQLHDVHRVDLRTGARTLEMTNDIGAVGFTADHRLVLRVAQVPTADGGFVVLHRNDAASEWEDLLAIDAEDAIGSGVVGFSRDDRTLYFLHSGGANAAELRAMDMESRELRVLATDPQADVDDLLFEPKEGRVQAAAVTKARPEWILLDESVRVHLDRLKALDPGDLHVLQRDRNDRHWLVAHGRDHGPTVYHAYDAETGETEFLFSSRPALEGLPLAPMEPVSFRSRDGLLVHGYLTLPPGEERKNLPAVVNVHGGPWHRDTWGLHPEAQWLANRGYACLQINFRGSTGYGKEFLNAGDREWGGRMQDDITDGTKWLIDEGIADPDRIGIYGGSYGGFAVLSGLTREPELYRCGVDIVGPSNLVTFSRSIPPYWEPLREMFKRRVGDVETEEEFLVSRSPLFQADRIQAPLLIVQGKNDPRVSREEALQIKSRMEEMGREVEFLEFADEGHGFVRPENRLRYYAVAERFLAAHLGGRYEPNGES